MNTYIIHLPPFCPDFLLFYTPKDKPNRPKTYKHFHYITGSPCNSFQGYCDVFFRCRGVDAEGPLARLKNLIFNPETLEDVRNWIVVCLTFWFTQPLSWLGQKNT